MKKIIFLCLIFSSFTNTSFNQNLVTNPDFEKFRICPDEINETMKRNHQLIQRWYTPSEATPDYFNTCSKAKNTGVPDNITGHCEPRSGNGYVGLILKVDVMLYEGSPHYAEHLQNRLSKGLKKDHLYCFEIWIRRGELSRFAAKDFGVWFTKTKMEFDNPPDTLPQPNIAYVSESYLTKSEWFPLRGVYKASGGERYLTVGNYQPWLFGRVKEVRGLTKHFLNKFAYYLVDDASLMEIKGVNECDCNMVTIPPLEPELTINTDTNKFIINEFDSVKVGESIILKNIFFAFDKSELLSESFTELNKLVMLMTKYPQMEIKISGHTDYIGGVEYNQKLSEARAKAVVDYLISKGIIEDRLQFFGYGKSQPIAENTTDEGRQQNRRVEFMILKK